MTASSWRRNSGFGLGGMRERVASSDGEIHIETAPGAGTIVRVILPAAHADVAGSITIADAG